MAEEKKSLKTELFEFYFANSWYSFFTISFLVFYTYSALFYFDNVILALKFVFHTFFLSTPLLEIEYLFWGVMFMVSLVLPFSISLYAIAMLPSLWKSKLQPKQKFISTIFLVIVTTLLIITMDDIIRIVAKQDVLSEFVQKNELTQRIVN